MSRPILMAVSSHAALGDTGKPTGAWMEELAASYYVFQDAGHEIVIASPRAGVAPIDPLSLEAPWLTPNGERFIADAQAQARLRGSIAFAAVKPQDYAAVYLVGGAATAWDFPDDTHLAHVVETLYAADRVVSGVCHGVLGLTGAKDPTGARIVKGRSVTGVSNAEEVMTGFDKLVPVMPEDRLNALGGRYSCAAPFEPHVCRDGNVLTGQNPASAGPLAQAVLERMRAGT